MLTVTHFTVLSALLFALGALAVLVRRNPLIMLMGIELMLNAVNLAFVAFFPLSGKHGWAGLCLYRADGRGG